MLLSLGYLLDRPVLSLETGDELARTSGLIIDPRTLKVVALYVDGRQLDEHPSVLHTADIREIAKMGCIVDASTVLMSPDGLVRLQEIIDLDFEIIGKPVKDEQGRKLGKVADANFDPVDFKVRQIEVSRPFLTSITQATLMIHRDQIVEVTDKWIVVMSPSVKEALADQVSAGASLLNAFRAPPVTEHSPRADVD